MKIVLFGILGVSALCGFFRAPLVPVLIGGLVGCLATWGVRRALERRSPGT